MRFAIFYDVNWKCNIQINPCAVVFVDTHGTDKNLSVITLTTRVPTLNLAEPGRSFLVVRMTPEEVMDEVCAAMAHGVESVASAPTENVRAITPQESAGPRALAALSDLVEIFERVNREQMPAGSAMAYVEDVLNQRGLLKGMVRGGR